jgi:fibronectin-binding autotransporter adhesin
MKTSLLNLHSRSKAASIRRICRRAFNSALEFGARSLAAVMVIFALFGFNPQTLAASSTWIGNTSANWLDSNWAGDNPPVTGDSLVFGAAGTFGSTLTDNLMTPGAYTIGGITFSGGASAYTINAATPGTNGFVLGSGASIVNLSSATQTINDLIGLTGTNNLATNASGGNLTIGGVISGANAGVLINGGGAVTFNQSAVNTYTGGTIINGATLNENFSNLTPSTDLINNTSALQLAGGNLTVTGNASNVTSQSFASTAITAGQNVITAANGASSTATISLGAITPTIGATVEFVGPSTSTAATPAGGTNGTAETAASNAATGIITTTTAGAGGASQPLGLLSGAGTAGTAYATVGLYDWATTDTTAAGAGSSPYTIIGGSQVPGFYTILNGNNVNTTSSLRNLDVTGNNSVISGAGSSRLTVSSLRFNVAAALTLSINSGSGNGNPVNVNGILITPNVGANNTAIIGRSGNNSNINSSNTTTEGLTVFQNNTLGLLTFNVGNSSTDVIVGTAGYIQGGAGTVSFLAANSYTGNTFLNGGTLEIAANSGLGGSATSNVNLNGGTLLGNYTGNLDNGTSAHPVILGGDGGGLAATGANVLNVDGLVSGATGTGALVIGIPASSANGSTAGLVPGTGAGTANTTAVNATGTVVLSNASNSYTGGTIIDSGVLQLSGAIGALGTGGITFKGGGFQWGSSTTADISARTVTLAGASSLDTNGNNVILANSIGNGGSGALTVKDTAGTGSLTLNGNNTFTGAVTVNSGATLKLGGANVYTGITSVNGTLTLNHASSLANTAITVGSVGILNASPGNGNINIGTTGATLTLSAGSTLSLLAADSDTIDTLTLNSTVATGAGTALTVGGTSAANLDFDLSSNASDELIINDGKTGFGAGGGKIFLTDLDSNTPLGSYILISDPSGGLITGAGGFQLGNTTLVIGGASYLLSLSTSTGTQEILTLSSASVNYYWTGASNSSWATLANFSTDHTGATVQTNVLSASSNVFLTADSAANFNQTLDGSYSINSLNFTGSGTSAASNSITLGAGSGGTLTLNASNAFADANGNNYVTGIGLVVQAGAAADTISDNVNLGGSQTWEIDNASANALTVTGVIADGSTSDSLTKTGVGTLILSNAESYDGGTIVSGGTLKLGTGGSLLSTGALTVRGTGTFDLGGNNQTVSALSDGGVATGTITSSTNVATLTVANSAPNTFSGAITDNNSGNGASLALTLAGSSSLTLSGSNSYAGLTTVTSGTLAASNNYSLGNSASSTGGLNLNPSTGTASVQFSSATPSIASLASSGAGSSSIVLGNTSGAGSSTTLTITGAGSGAGTTFSGVISDLAGTKSTAIGNVTLSAGNLTLGGADTFTGATNLNGGTLTLGNSLALQDSILALGGGTLSFGTLSAATLGGLTGTQNVALTNTTSGAVALTIGNNNETSSYNGSLSGAGSVTKAGTGNVTFSNANYTGATTINGGTLVISGGTVGSPTSNLVIAEAGNGLNLSGGTLTAGTVNIAINSGQTGGSASITGSGSAIFGAFNIGSAQNTAGNLTINTTGSVALGIGTVVRDNGGAGNGLIVEGGTVTANSLFIQGLSDKVANLNITGGSLTIGNSASNGAFEIGTAGDGGVLAVTGGSLTYTGSDGLLLSQGSAITATASISGPSTVATLTGITVNAGNAATVTSQLTVSGTATLYLGSVGLVVNQPSATVSATFGTATIGAIAPWSSVAPISLTGTTTFRAADSNSVANNITLSGVLSGAGGLAVSGAGTVTLAGVDTYTGSTAVNTGGTLIVSGSITGTTATTIASSAKLEVDNLLTSTTPAAVSGKLQGVGSINGATVTDGDLAPGLTAANSSSSVGTLTSTTNVSLDSASILSIRIGLTTGAGSNPATGLGGDADQLLVSSGALSLNDSTLTIGTGAFAQLDTLYVIVNGGASGTGAGFDVFANAPASGSDFADTAGDTYEIFYAANADGTNIGSGNDIVIEEITAVPEPGTWASLLGGAGMLIVWQRTRRRRR